jgi:hypothetical protein
MVREVLADLLGNEQIQGDERQPNVGLRIPMGYGACRFTPPVDWLVAEARFGLWKRPRLAFEFLLGY